MEGQFVNKSGNKQADMPIKKKKKKKTIQADYVLLKSFFFYIFPFLLSVIVYFHSTFSGPEIFPVKAS
jgi:hypothetical protein